jgi:hypothetical protein
MKNIPIKVITKEQADKMGLRGKPQIFVIGATGKKGKPAHTITIHNLETGEKQFLLKNNVKKEFKGFKTK